MGDEAGMKYDRVGTIADGVLKAVDDVAEGSKKLGEALSPVTYVPVPSVPGFNAFGNTSKAVSCGSDYADTLTAAADASELLGALLDRDEKRLRKVIQIFRTTDHEEADRICANSAKSLDVYSAHVHSHGLHGNDETVRAMQIDKLHDSIDGPSVIGADLNAITEDGQTDWKMAGPQSIASFAQEGYTVYSGASTPDGAIAGTSPTGTRIDHVIGSPSVEFGGRPQLVDGGSSDHDGQKVDLIIPDW
ncbi:endonuclease/exonuclease/phosphatase family protein [Nonomuraea sp. CA-143628]|uniref:endonuclease/exonuclease/phosphatase family protein n=1 Tax=Nonomuraea sp. CA-143628 TaxID=3239997 RepID=UPI003D90A160